jgi:trk system potassium uptake protein TrkA
MSGTSAQIIEYTVTPGSRITKKPLKDLGFPSGAIIGGVIRGKEAMIAVGNTIIEPHDRVAIFTLPDTIKEVDRFFK